MIRSLVLASAAVGALSIAACGQPAEEPMVDEEPAMEDSMAAEPMESDTMMEESDEAMPGDGEAMMEEEGSMEEEAM